MLLPFVFNLSTSPPVPQNSQQPRGAGDTQSSLPSTPSPETSSFSSVEEDNGEKTRKPKSYVKWTHGEQQVLVRLWTEKFDRLASKDARKVWDKIVRELNNKFGMNQPVDKCKAKIKYLIDKYKGAKDWNLKQSRRHRRQTPFYEEIDAVLGCRDVVTLHHVVEAGASASDSCKEQDNREETDPRSSGESRSDRKRKKRGAQVEEQDEEERNMLKESPSGLQEQRKEMREFMETFNKTQEQQVNTMNALVGALTTFL